MSETDDRLPPIVNQVQEITATQGPGKFPVLYALDPHGNIWQYVPNTRMWTVLPPLPEPPDRQPADELLPSVDY